MNRIPVTPRPNWQYRVEAAGLTFHSPDAMPDPYWNESAAYEFTTAEIDTLEAATATLQQMCLAAAQHILDEKRYADLAIPEAAIPVIEQAWNQEPPALYGRFDVSWAGARSGHPPKLLEYNADTPTALLEAAVIQWDWLKEMTPQLKHPLHGGDPDQFNSIHDKLIAKWKDLHPYLEQPLYFCGLDDPEDQLTLVYLRDTAQQAGFQTIQMFMEEIGWNDEHRVFLDPGDDRMASIVKLYPWESMLAEEFGPAALATYAETRWIEPIWKMLLSNKGLLPILWQLYPNHELLLEAHFDTPPTSLSSVTPSSQGLSSFAEGGGPAFQSSQPLSSFREAGGPASVSGLSSFAEGGGPAFRSSQPLSSFREAGGPAFPRDYVRKPLLSREGANITLVRNGQTAFQTEGPYTGPTITQTLAPEAVFPAPDGQPRYPVLGLWMVDQDPAGMGIRESRTPITDNLSSFVPHYFI